MHDQRVTPYDEVHDRICAAVASLPQQQCQATVPATRSRRFASCSRTSSQDR